MTDTTIALAAFEELQATAGEDFAKELIGTFLEEAPAMLTELRAALAAGDGESFRRAAHSLKSNSQTFGAQTLAAMARTLELGGLPPGSAALDALAQEYTRAAAALAELRDA